MLDLAITGGLAFIDGSFRKADIGIKDQKIAMVTEPGCLPEAARTIDATGKHVIPGGVDTHVHFRDPGHAERETFAQGTRAACAGGCTTFFEHPISIPPQYNSEILHSRVDNCNAHSYVDYCFFGAAGGEFPECIEPLSHEGIIAYKTFLHAAPEGRDEEFKGLTSANNAQLMRALEEGAKTPLTVAAHADDNELVNGYIAQLRAEGKQGQNMAHCWSRPPIVEVEAIAKMLRFGKETGCKIELVHVSTADSMELAKQAKAEGQFVLMETCPHYLLLDESYVEKYGPYAKCNPALRSKEEIERLWQYVLDGTVDFIGSDHSPFLKSEKEKDPNDIFKAPSGFPGIDLRLPLMATEAKKGRLSLERVVELCCVNPAKLFHIYPQKGNLLPGADADVVVMDMNADYVWNHEMSESHAKDIGIVYDGWKLGCKIDYTTVRGRVVYDNGVVNDGEGAEGWGEWVKPHFD